MEGNSLSKTDVVSGVPRLIDKDMVRKSISKMRNGKAAGPSGVLSEMVKATGKAGVGMITDLLNQIIIEGVIPAEWKLRTVINCYQGKSGSLERGNYRGVKLTVQILRIDRIIEKLIRQQVDIREM